MKNAARRTWNTVRDARGTEVAEMAAVIPLLFMVVMGIFWFGQAFRIYGTLAHAAREGARAAVAPVCATCTAPTGTGPGLIAQTAVQNDLAAAHANPSQLINTSKWTAPVMCQCNSGSTSPTSCTTTVSCDGSATSVCVQENVQLSYPTNAQGGMGTCGTAVSMRYQYPFHFTIPLTNLDLWNIQLPGQAEMRAEIQ
jgi:Flp pilus assembly protein TadG